MYKHCHRHEMATTVGQLERFPVDVSCWISANRLKMNPEKTELIWAGSKFSHGWVAAACLQIDSNIVEASDHVRVLGVNFSSDLSLDKHVSSVCAACFSGFVSFDEFNGHWTTSPARRLFTPSSRPGWITAT